MERANVPTIFRKTLKGHMGAYSLDIFTLVSREIMEQVLLGPISRRGRFLETGSLSLWQLNHTKPSSLLKGLLLWLRAEQCMSFASTPMRLPTLSATIFFFQTRDIEV